MNSKIESGCILPCTVVIESLVDGTVDGAFIMSSVQAVMGEGGMLLRQTYLYKINCNH